MPIYPEPVYSETPAGQSVLAEYHPQWFVVQTKARLEAKALVNLQRQGYRAYLPQLKTRKRQRNQWRDVIEPLFAGYLFLHLDLNRDNAAPVRSTLGAIGLVRFGESYHAIPDTVIRYLMSNEPDRCGDDKATVRRLFEQGDRVELLNGPFAGLTAVYQMEKSSDRAILLLNVLGGQQSVAVSIHDIAPVAQL
ncbi:MAG: transcription termination/antitermination NusG family protein [Porticoccaceae bacterium]